MKINKFRASKKVIFICIVSLLTIFICGAVYAAQSDSIARTFGIQQATILSVNDKSAVASIDGEKITKKGFDTYKLLINTGESKLSDRQILDKIVEREVIYKKALKDNVTITDEDITNLINTSKDAIKSSKEQYVAFQDYISGLNITEDQYWESVIPAYKKFLICGKYKNNLKDDFSKKNNIKDKNELDKKFNPVFNDHIKELKKNVKVEYYIN